MVDLGQADGNVITGCLFIKSPASTSTVGPDSSPGIKGKAQHHHHCSENPVGHSEIIPSPLVVAGDANLTNRLLLSLLGLHVREP